MPLIAKETGGSEIPSIPNGEHPARCVLVADLGIHYDAMHDRDRHQCLLGFEFPTLLHVFDEEKGKEPRMLSEFFTITLSEKSKLRPFLESWRGRPFTAQELSGFDLFSVAGAACHINVQPKENGKPRIFKIRPAKQGEVPSQMLETRLLSMGTAEPQRTRDLEAMPEWIAKIARESKEMQQATGTGDYAPAPTASPAPEAREPGAEVEYDIPF